MASVNKVILVGNLGQDPEVKYMPSGGAATNVSIATTDSWKDKDTGQKQERTEWHRVVFFNRLAEIVGQYLKKGSQVYIEGRLQTKKWQDQSGQDRYTTEIIASSMQMLGGKGAGTGDGATDYSNNNAPPQQQSQQQAPQQSSGQQQAAPQQQNTPPPQSFDNFDDDIPF